MKTNRLFCLASVLSGLLSICPRAHAEEQIYGNTNYGFQFAVPPGWHISDTVFDLCHYSYTFLTVDNLRPDLEVREQPTGPNSMGFSPGTIVQQLKPGEVYVAFGYAGGPGPETMRPETVDADLHALLATNGISQSSTPGLSMLDLSFFKRGHRWTADVYLRDPVTEDNRRQALALLTSFQFVKSPVENAAWAESLAWQKLPEEFQAAKLWWRGWPTASQLAEPSGSPVSGLQSVAVEKLTSTYSVKFAWQGVGHWEFTILPDGSVQTGPSAVYPVDVLPFELPLDLPGKDLGTVNVWWLAPGVQASQVSGKTTVTWFDQAGRVERQVANAEIDSSSRFLIDKGREVLVKGINEDWAFKLPSLAPPSQIEEIRATPDSHVLVEEYHPRPGRMMADIYVHGRRVNTVGPFISYMSEEIVLNDDGSTTLLASEAEPATSLQQIATLAQTHVKVIVLGTNGATNFTTECARAVYSPETAPDGSGVLLRPNGGQNNQNTFLWFTKFGLVRSMDISSNPELAGWIPHSQKSLFMTSVGQDEYQFQLIDWDTGRRLWNIPRPGSGQFLGLTVTSGFVIISMAESIPSSVPDDGADWTRTFYAIDTANGKVVARWSGQIPHRSPPPNRDRFLQLHDHLFYLTSEACTEINLDDITTRQHGWQ